MVGKKAVVEYKTGVDESAAVDDWESAVLRFEESLGMGWVSRIIYLWPMRESLNSSWARIYFADPPWTAYCLSRRVGVMVLIGMTS